MPITGNRAGGNRHPTRLAPMKRIVCGEIEPVEEPQPVRRKKGEGRAKRVVDEDAVAGTH